MSDINPDTPLVVVFHSGDPELLPLAESALEQAGIEYLVRRGGGGVPVGFGHTPEFGGAEGAADLFVSAADADRASALLADLAVAPEGPFDLAPMAPSPASGTGVAAAPVTGPREYRLTELDSGTAVGELTESQLRFLVDELEEESATDRDYYIDAATIDMLAAAGADAELLAMLKRALGSREGVEVKWSRL
jgi:hypothetical protein